MFLLHQRAEAGSEGRGIDAGGAAERRKPAVPALVRLASGRVDVDDRHVEPGSHRAGRVVTDP